MNGTHREIDSLGEVGVPIGAFYGSQSMCAINNFSISGIPISHLSQLVHAPAMIKKAAVLANASLGDIPPAKGAAIAAACDDIIAGNVTADFPIDVFQGGAGTSRT